MKKMTVVAGARTSNLRRKATAYRYAHRQLMDRLDEMARIYKMVVEQVVYIEHPPGVPDGPKVYKRTMNLLKSIKAIPYRQGNRAWVHIYFDSRISKAWDGAGSYSVYVPLSEGYLTDTRHWTSDWRKRAYDAVLNLCADVLRMAEAL